MMIVQINSCIYYRIMPIIQKINNTASLSFKSVQMVSVYLIMASKVLFCRNTECNAGNNRPDIEILKTSGINSAAHNIPPDGGTFPLVFCFNQITGGFSFITFYIKYCFDFSGI